MKSLKLFVLFLVVLVACQNTSTESGQVKVKEEVEFDISIKECNVPLHTSLRGISVLSEDVAWLSGAKGNIEKTQDGGISWQKLPMPDQDSLDFRSIHAFSENAALIVSAGFPARVFKTVNSGESWTLVYEITDSAAFMNSIAFKNKKEGIIMGDQLKGRHIILRTGDGGDTWRRIDSIDIPKPLKVENAFAASGSCIAVSRTGRFFIGFGGENARVFSSVNGFKWKAKSTPMYHGSASSGIYSIASSGEGHLMAVGGDYTKIDSNHFPVVSSNDGKSWIKTKAPVGGYRSIVDYSSKENIWLAAGTNGLDMSYDHGDSWIKISDENINTLQFAPNSSKAFMANSKGDILIINISLKLKKD